MAAIGYRDSNLIKFYRHIIYVLKKKLDAVNLVAVS